MSSGQMRRPVVVQAPHLRMRWQDRARVEQVTRLLSPGGSVAHGSASAASPELYMPFPSWRGVRALIPVTSRRAAAAAVGLRAAGDLSPRGVAHRAAAIGMRTGVLQRLHRGRLDLAVSDVAAGAGPESLAGHVGTLLGVRVHLAANVGRVDPHRTVAIHVLDDTGRLVAFGKVTDSPLSMSQLRTEASVLQRIERHGTRLLEAPRLMHCEPWEGTQILLTSPLDLTTARRPSLDRPPKADVLLEVAAARWWPQEPLLSSEYWTRTRRRLEALSSSEPHPEIAAARALATSIERYLGAEVLQLGAWHGDWLPWNMAWQNGRLLAWDWEYATDCAPLGFDAFHFVCGGLFFRGRADAATSLREAWREVAPELARAGLSRRQAACVHVLYALEFLLRRLDIVVAGGGADDARVFPGIAPAVEESLRRARDGG